MPDTSDNIPRASTLENNINNDELTSFETASENEDTNISKEIRTQEQAKISYGY